MNTTPKAYFPQYEYEITKENEKHQVTFQSIIRFEYEGVFYEALLKVSYLSKEEISIETFSEFLNRFLTDCQGRKLFSKKSQFMTADENQMSEQEFFKSNNPLFFKFD